jgi:two-component system, cell cycle response regulator DivK
MPRILLVEDNPEHVLLITRFLRRQNYEVICAGDGPEGVRLAQTERPDLILMDIRLPNYGDGQKATREIRALDDMQTIPIIALTASVMPEQVRDIFEAGCTEVVEKPIDYKHLLGRIASLLAGGTTP